MEFQNFEQEIDIEALKEEILESKKVIKMKIFKKIKVSKRGLTFSGSELERADLNIGSSFSIEINTKLNKVTIFKKESRKQC